MQAVHSGQCGLCNHFGEHHAKSSVLVTILTSKKADAEVLASKACGAAPEGLADQRVRWICAGGAGLSAMSRA